MIEKLYNGYDSLLVFSLNYKPIPICNLNRNVYASNYKQIKKKSKDWEIKTCGNS